MSESFWRDRRVLVTGGNGLVGSWLCKRLLDEGASVVVLMRDHIPESNFHRLGLEAKVDAVSGGLEDYDLIARAVVEHEVESCFHLAAQAIVGVANHSPLSTFESNIRGTWNLMEALRLGRGVRAVVVASSDKAYGRHEKLPYTEKAPLTPTFPYDTSKACADLIAMAYHHTFSLPVTVTRFANIYGGGDMNFSRIIPDTIRSVLKGRDPVVRSDGTPERDFVHVDDVVNLYMEIGSRLPHPGMAGQVFNGGHNRPVKILDLVEKIIALSGRTGLKPDVRGVGAGHGEIDRQWLDATKANEVLGWAPKVGLDEGLERTLKWYREALEA
ncbi:MAG: GDP-mannose 4,6-dehydratase [Planctomycetota bacterium]|jgi:CDP-glucose 4,6-dehydratase